jgi:hypothetical protein
MSSASSNASGRTLAWYRKHDIKILICIFNYSIQWSFGGVTPSSDIWRLIEEIHAEDEEKLEDSFNTADFCIRKRTDHYFGNLKIEINESGHIIGYEDECDAAAYVYQCGRELAPNVTSSFYTHYTANGSSVTKIFFENVFKSLNF